MNTLTDAVKGTHCAYALRLQGDAHATEYYYVGSTSDIQTRIAQHTGAIPGGAPSTRGRAGRGALRYRLSGSLRGIRALGIVRREMQDYDRVRGAKFCMLEPLRFAPTGWKTRPQTLKRSIEEVDEDLELDDFPLGQRAA